MRGVTMNKTKPFVIDYRRPRVLIGNEIVDAEGNIFKSVKEMEKAKGEWVDGKCNAQINPIIYCPYCGAGNRDTAWGFPREQRKLKKHNGQCPNCGERLTMEYRDYVDYNPRVVVKEDEEPIEVARITARSPGAFPAQLKWWPISDGKLAIETVVDLCFNRTMYGQYWVQHDILRHRIIFNFDTGLCYSMRGIDRKGNPSEYSKQQHRLQNRTMTYMDVVPFAIQQDFIGVVLGAMHEYKGVPYEEAKKVYTCAGKNIGRDTLGLVNYFSEMKPNDLGDMLDMDILYRNHRDSVKRTFRNLIALSKSNEVDWLPKYMQKRSIRNRLNKRAIVFYLYKWLHACGIKDVNIMNRVVDHYIDKYENSEYDDDLPFDNAHHNKTLTRIICTYCLDSEETKHNAEFMKWALKDRDANSVYHFITGVFANQPYLFTDSARMHKLIMAMGENLPCNTGNIKELHDELTVTHNKCKNKNLTIQYTKEEQCLEMDLDGYSFRLAKDTDSLYDIGKAMSICVGSYGRSAAAKRCTIVTMSKDDKYVACIELRPYRKKLVMQQLKGRFNHTVKEIEPVTAWVAATGINAECHDYYAAVEHKENSFDGWDHDYHVENPRLNEPTMGNYADWGFDFDDGPF